MFGKRKYNRHGLIYKVIELLFISVVVLIAFTLQTLPAIAQDEVIPIYSLNDLARVGSGNEYNGYVWSLSASYRMANVKRSTT